MNFPNYKITFILLNLLYHLKHLHPLHINLQKPIIITLSTNSSNSGVMQHKEILKSTFERKSLQDYKYQLFNRI